MQFCSIFLLFLIVTFGCGGISTENNTYFSMNTDSPPTLCRMKSCRVTPEICQLRLDFWTFVINGPSTEGQCLQDTFTVSGGRGSRGTPIICGTNSGDHGKQVFLALALALVKVHLKQHLSN